jgi:hypothetical protein
MSGPWFDDPAVIRGTVACDWCGDDATWYLRRRFAGEGVQTFWCCSRHRVAARKRLRTPRRTGETPVEIDIIARYAF